MSGEERELLMAWTRRQKTANALAMRSRIVLAAAGGESNSEIAERLGVHRNTREHVATAVCRVPT